MREDLYLETIIPCLGIDGHQHHCIAWADTTLCGIKIESKKDGLTQHRADRLLYSCWECDAQVDELLIEREKQEKSK